MSHTSILIQVALLGSRNTMEFTCPLMCIFLLKSYTKFCLKVVVGKSCTPNQYNNFTMATLRLCSKMLCLYILCTEHLPQRNCGSTGTFQDKMKINISLSVWLFFIYLYLHFHKKTTILKQTNMKESVGDIIILNNQHLI